MRTAVRDDEAVEFERSAQDSIQKLLVATAGDAANRRVTAHDSLGVGALRGGTPLRPIVA